MSDNIVICGIIVLVISLFLSKQENNQNNQITLLYVILIGGIVYTLINNGMLVKNAGSVEAFNEDKDEDENNVNDYNDDNDDNENDNADEMNSDDQSENNFNQPNIESFTPNNNINVQQDNTITPSDLLPSSTSNKFNDDPNVVLSTDILEEQYLDATRTIGMMSSTLRNANYDLRCAPPIPRIDVGPWQQTTMEADPFRKPLEGPECGGCNKNN